MTFTQKNLIVVYIVVFVLILTANTLVHIFLVGGSDSEIAQTHLLEFSQSLVDLLEVAFGALIGALSASLQYTLGRKDQLKHLSPSPPTPTSTSLEETPVSNDSSEKNKSHES